MLKFLSRLFGGSNGETSIEDPVALELVASREEKHAALQGLRTKTQELRATAGESESPGELAVG